MRFIIHMIILSLFVMATFVDAVLIRRPACTAATVGGTVEFHCQSNITNREIDWVILANGTHVFEKPLYIYTLGVVEKDFADRFYVNRTGSGHYVLTVRDTKTSDRITIACRDKGGLGETASATLSVVDCSSIVAPLFTSHSSPETTTTQTVLSNITSTYHPETMLPSPLYVHVGYLVLAIICTFLCTVVATLCVLRKMNMLCIRMQHNCLRDHVHKQQDVQVPKPPVEQKDDTEIMPLDESCRLKQSGN